MKSNITEGKVLVYIINYHGWMDDTKNSTFMIIFKNININLLYYYLFIFILYYTIKLNIIYYICTAVVLKKITFLISIQPL